MSNYLIKDDRVQLDRAIYFMRVRIAALKDEVDQLKTENQQLRNRPEQVSHGVSVERPKEKINMDLPVDQWHIPHFVKRFQQLYEQKYATPRVIKGSEWRTIALRCKTFRDSHIEIQDNVAFKGYIEWLFKEKFTKKFIASFPLICSNNLFYEWNALTRPTKKAAEIVRPVPTEADLKALEAEFEAVRKYKNDN